MGQAKISVENNIDSYSSKYWHRKEIIQEYLSTKEESTAKKYKTIISEFFQFSSKKQVHTQKTRIVAEFKKSLIARGLKGNTINSRLSVLRDFFKFTTEQGYTDYSPAKFVSNVRVDPTEVKQAKAITKDELLRLFKSPNRETLKGKYEYMMLNMVFRLALRYNELANVKIKDMILYDDQPVIRIEGKGKKVRVLGLDSVTREAIQDFLGAFPLALGLDDYLFQQTYFRERTKQEKPVSRYSVTNAMLKHAHRANVNVEGISTHSARATAINILLDNEVQLRDVANFVGHVSIETTRRYDRKDQEGVLKTGNFLEKTLS